MFGISKKMKEHQHPKGLFVLFAVEAMERFGYYGMRALLTLYMVGFLFKGSGEESEITSRAGTIYGWFTGLVYLTPVIGGYLADRYLGQRKSIVIGAILMGLGYFIMAIPYVSFFYLALGAVILGNGFFKPNVSTLVGQLYDAQSFDETTKERDVRKEAGYIFFYMGINLGAMFSPFICGTLGEKLGWHWGFISAGVGMIISIIILSWGRKHLGTAGLLPSKKEKKREQDRPLTIVEKHRIAVIFILAFFVIFFWITFEQAGSSLTLFAARSTDRTIFGFEVPVTWFQSVNPVLIVLLAPMFARLWMNLGKRNMDPSTPRKMSFGLFLASAGFLILIPASSIASEGTRVSMLWLIGVYLTHTIGELCLSPIGLAMVNKLAPVKFLSLLMGVWFTSNFAANLVAGLFAGLYDQMDMTTFFVIPAATAGVSGIILLIISSRLAKWMHKEEEEELLSE